MQPKEFLAILSRAEKLKDTLRHSYTSGGRRESVAEHCWRLTLMAMLLTGEEEFRELDMNRVIRMCLIHDLGETFTGDIPAFEKNEAQEDQEQDALSGWLESFSEPTRTEWAGLLEEMTAQQSREARLYKALDKMEAVIQHNESDLATWLPLEYELQFTHGREQVQFSPWLRALKQDVDRWTAEKIEKA